MLRPILRPSFFSACRYKIDSEVAEIQFGVDTVGPGQASQGGEYSMKSSGCTICGIPYDPAANTYNYELY